jgi:hypothetical protein
MLRKNDAPLSPYKKRTIYFHNEYQVIFSHNLFSFFFNFNSFLIFQELIIHVNFIVTSPHVKFRFS